MLNILLASTSSLYGGEYLDYLKPQLSRLYEETDEITFIPYARPGGISHDDYTRHAADFFKTIGKSVRGIHTYANPKEAIAGSRAFFTGGGNTFLLVKSLYDNDLMEVLGNEVRKGKPYLGTSAGSNIGGLTMQTTNDMPIVYPPSFKTLGLVPFNINPHYLDPIAGLKHNGETRETRIIEFLSQNSIPVVGLREGDWIRGEKGRITVEGSREARIFESGKAPYEVAPGTRLDFD